MAENCTICGEHLNWLRVGTGNGGAAHRHCYEKAHQPRAAQSIYDMARGIGDPVLAAEVMHEMVPNDLAREIVAAFNVRLMKAWRRRCEP
jgi:hypothetical protein